MPVNTYSDGFPLTPLEAIEFSYFLSEGEKQEWREWLQTATIEQQNELVDILHSMWQDNQKQVVPSGFDQQPSTDFAQTQPPVTSNTPDTGFSNETFSAPVNTPALDTGFAGEHNLGLADASEVELPAQNQNISTQPQYQSTQIQTPEPVAPAQPAATPAIPETDNFTFVESVNNNQPQFADNFKSPDLSQPQIQSQTPSAPAAPVSTAPVQPQTEDLSDLEQLDEHPLSQPIATTQDETQEFALRKMANTKYKPNPVLDDKTPPLDEFVYKNGPNSNNNSNPYPKSSDRSDNAQPARSERREQSREPRDNPNQNRDRNENRNDTKGEMREPAKEPRDNRDPNKDNRSKPAVTEDRKKSFFGSSQLRESSSKVLLDEVYKLYQDTRSKNNQSGKDLDEKFNSLLDKIMQVIANSGQLADYYETIIEKIIEVNDKVVSQAKEIQLLKNNTQSRGGVSLQEQVDEVRDDIERLNRDTRTMRIEQRRKYDEITSQLVSFDADAFNRDGLIHRIDLLKSELIQIQQKIGISSPDRNADTQNARPRPDLSSAQPSRPQNSNPNRRQQNSNPNQSNNRSNPQPIPDIEE